MKGFYGQGTKPLNPLKPQKLKSLKPGKYPKPRPEPTLGPKPLTPFLEARKV